MAQPPRKMARTRMILTFFTIINSSISQKNLWRDE